MLEFEKSELEVKAYGKSFKLKYPTTGDIEAMQDDKLKENGEVPLSSVYNFLENLGLKKEEAKKFEPKHLKSLISALSGEDEKK